MVDASDDDEDDGMMNANVNVIISMQTVMGEELNQSVGIDSVVNENHHASYHHHHHHRHRHVQWLYSVDSVIINHYQSIVRAVNRRVVDFHHQHQHQHQ